MPTISQILQILAIAYAVFILVLMLVALATYQGLREIAGAIRDSYTPVNSPSEPKKQEMDFMVRLNDARPRRKE